VSVQATTACREIRGVVPLIRNHTSRWKWVVDFTPRPFYTPHPPIKNPSTLSTGGGVGPRACFDRLDKRKVLLPDRDSKAGPSKPQPCHYNCSAVLVILNIERFSGMWHRVVWYYRVIRVADTFWRHVATECSQQNPLTVDAVCNVCSADHYELPTATIRNGHHKLLLPVVTNDQRKNLI